MRAFTLVATLCLLMTVSLAKFYQPGPEVMEKLIDLELKRDAYKYGKQEKPEESTEGGVMKRVYQARSVFIAYALKNGYNTEYMTYFAMWFVASFSLLGLVNYALKRIAAAKDMDKMEKDKIMGVYGELAGERKKENLVGEL